jgi:hypothetical protein
MRTPGGRFKLASKIDAVRLLGKNSGSLPSGTGMI